MSAATNMAVEVKLRNENLIDLVREFPYLYDKGNANFKNLVMKESRWLMIANALKVSVHRVTTRWRGLRDRYVREKRERKNSLPSGSGQTNFNPWRLYAILDGFLGPSCEPRETADNMEESFIEDVSLEDDGLENNVLEDNSLEDTISSQSVASSASFDVNVDSPANITTERRVSACEAEVPKRKRRCTNESDSSYSESFSASSAAFVNLVDNIQSQDDDDDEIAGFGRSVANRLRELPKEKQRRLRFLIETFFFEECE